MIATSSYMRIGLSSRYSPASTKTATGVDFEVGLDIAGAEPVPIPMIVVTIPT